MYRDSNESSSRSNAVRRDEYTARSSVRPKSASGIRRIVFFGLASLWGFIVGVAGLIATMRFSGLLPGNGDRTVDLSDFATGLDFEEDPL